MNSTSKHDVTYFIFLVQHDVTYLRVERCDILDITNN